MLHKHKCRLFWSASAVDPQASHRHRRSASPPHTSLVTGGPAAEASTWLVPRVAQQAEGRWRPPRTAARPIDPIRSVSVGRVDRHGKCDQLEGGAKGAASYPGKAPLGPWARRALPLRGCAAGASEEMPRQGYGGARSIPPPPAAPSRPQPALDARREPNRHYLRRPRGLTREPRLPMLWLPASGVEGCVG